MGNVMKSTKFPQRSLEITLRGNLTWFANEYTGPLILVKVSGLPSRVSFKNSCVSADSEVIDLPFCNTTINVHTLSHFRSIGCDYFHFYGTVTLPDGRIFDNVNLDDLVEVDTIMDWFCANGWNRADLAECMAADPPRCRRIFTSASSRRQ